MNDPVALTSYTAAACNGSPPPEGQFNTVEVEATEHERQEQMVDLTAFTIAALVVIVWRAGLERSASLVASFRPRELRVRADFGRGGGGGIPPAIDSSASTPTSVSHSWPT